jgi:hypothetical protein
MDRSVFLFGNEAGRHMLLMRIKSYRTAMDRFQFHLLNSFCKMKNEDGEEMFRFILRVPGTCGPITVRSLWKQSGGRCKTAGLVI